MATKFCWACSKKLYGGRFEELKVDGYLRTLHKICAKKVKSGYDYKKIDEEYHSMMWTTWERDF